MKLWPFSKRYLDKNQEAEVVAAIGRAEEGNLGEVRVHLERKCPHEEGALERAKQIFYEQGMCQTEDATGVLLYVAIKDRLTAVYAGPGIHTCCPEAFWQKVTDRVAEGFKEGAPAKGLVEAVDEVGDLLREQVPGEKEVNELPDEVTMA